MAFTKFRTALTVLNLVGSLLSFFGASFIAICYFILPIKRHFRHALILNLAISDMINGLTLSISGMYIAITRKDLTIGAPCTVNGFFTQLSVQGTDCCILAITLVTLFSITKGSFLHHANEHSQTKLILVCAACWVLPVTTSITGLALRKYGPVSGNWCWIVGDPHYLRYVLTHGWRFLIIFTCIGLYVYLHFWLKRHFSSIEQYNMTRRRTAQTVTGRPGIGSRMKTIWRNLPKLHRKEEEVDALDRIIEKKLGSESRDTVTVCLSAELPANAARVKASTGGELDTSGRSAEEPQLISLSMNPFAHRQTFDDDDDDEGCNGRDSDREFNVADEFSISSSAAPPELSSHVHPSDRRRTPTFALPDYSCHFHESATTTVNAETSGFGNRTAIYSMSGTENRNSCRLSIVSTRSTRLTLKRVNRILLMNAYPAAYIILWIPGLCNRLVEASGHSSKVLQVMQASTQFVGLANAITYGWNERIAELIRRRFFGA